VTSLTDSDLNDSRLQYILERTHSLLNFSKEEEEIGLEIHEESIVIDSLVPRLGIMPFIKGLAKKYECMAKEGRPLSEIRNESDRTTFSRLIDDPIIKKQYLWSWRKSGVTCANNALWPPGEPGFDGAIKNISKSKRIIDVIGDLTLVKSHKDIINAKKKKKNALLWSLLNTTALGGGFDISDELNNLDIFYGLGVRAMELTFNYRNFAGDGCMERYQSGLSHFGLKIVERMNDLRMLIDVSHAGYQTTLDAVDFSAAPIAATHTMCKGLVDHFRGKSDEEMASIADRGGYIGICQVPPYLGGNGTIKEFLDHIDYAVELVGIDHIGIGTNNIDNPFSPKRYSELQELANKTPVSSSDWWLGVRAHLSREMFMETLTGSLSWINWPYFTVGLVTRGYSKPEIQKIIGGNFLRILKTVIG
jgi:membrane dipeptidase